ncbi:5025_t:CDS:2 [Funneliformis mosseae]|uniref:5025_t:CDS:1 n=1 Tax=Funneliformis mosseae TaxID=27381 RepID=A0A9N9BI40_FUNMO|nr:5025_t:CDS:2 [Funneliformis mosseae]
MAISSAKLERLRILEYSTNNRIPIDSQLSQYLAAMKQQNGNEYSVTFIHIPSTGEFFTKKILCEKTEGETTGEKLYRVTWGEKVLAILELWNMSKNFFG